MAIETTPACVSARFEGNATSATVASAMRLLRSTEGDVIERDGIPLPFHQHTIPQEEWDVSETNFGVPYPRNKELNAPYGYQTHDYPRNQI